METKPVATRVNPKYDTILTLLELISRHHGLSVSADRVVNDYCIQNLPITTNKVLRIARANGLRAKSVRLNWKKLASLGEAFPVIARLNTGNSVVVSGFRQEGKETQVVVLDPLATTPGFMFISQANFELRWEGEVILLKRDFSLMDLARPFGLTWFIPELLQQRHALIYVLIAGLALHGIGLITPLFFQIVIDKVLVHNSESTLIILGIGVSLAIMFEMTLTFLRNFLLLFATSKIDIRLATRTFDHLVSLPLHFFETTSVGVVTKHMQQVERIREFFTGKVLSVFMDSWALIIFLPILLLYNVQLTLVVLGFALAIGCSLLVVMPMFRRELENLYQAEGQRQSLLVETIHGMRAVKALALEPGLKQRWGQGSALSVTRQVRVAKISLGATAWVGLLEKMSTVVLVWFGALKVFDGSLSVGELIAIQMLAGRVCAPLVAIVSLINEAQQVMLSVKMLGEVMNRKPEQQLNKNGLRQPLKGEISLEKATFYYPGMSSPALEKIDLHIPPNSLIGIVGRSGSGKSTLLRLLQGLYIAQQGCVRFDGFDIKEMDLSHLRQNIGVVLQDSFIFRGTVRENIAMTFPGADMSDVVRAASLAGADEFIQRLPQGYETFLEENASNLSGGQKQRLAIARALISQPSILIFDEATSALDPESEAIVQTNMAKIAQGRTVILVSHRLTSLVNSDKIYVLDHGKVVAASAHRELLTSCDVYRHLWKQQVGHVL